MRVTSPKRDNSERNCRDKTGAGADCFVRRPWDVFIIDQTFLALTFSPEDDCFDMECSILFCHQGNVELSPFASGSG